MPSPKVEIALRDYLNEGEVKLTKQRKFILDIFGETKLHLTVEELYNLVKQQHPNIGLITVYRTLRILCECGLASRFRHSDGSFRYELMQKSHSYLKCTKCGLLTEYADPEIEALHTLLAAKNNFKISHSRLELYGICPECS